MALASDTSYSSVNTKPIINTNSNGTICSIYRQTIYYSSSTDMIYVNSDLASGERDHYVIRGVLYYLGFPGKTGKLPDEYFLFAAQQRGQYEHDRLAGRPAHVYGSKISKGMDLTTIQDMLTT